MSTSRSVDYFFYREYEHFLDRAMKNLSSSSFSCVERKKTEDRLYIDRLKKLIEIDSCFLTRHLVEQSSSNLRNDVSLEFFLQNGQPAIDFSTFITFLRAEVPIDRLAAHAGFPKDDKTCIVAGIKNRLWCSVYGLEGAIESGVKTIVSGTAVLVLRIANCFFKSQGNISMWEDMVKTYADSTWRCATAIIIPNKTLADSCGKIGCSAKSLKIWGTFFDKEKASYVEMLSLGRHAQA